MSKATKFFTVDFYEFTKPEDGPEGIDAESNFGNQVDFQPERLPGMDGVVIRLECDDESGAVKVTGVTTVGLYIEQNSVFYEVEDKQNE